MGATLTIGTRKIGKNELWWLTEGVGGHGPEPATVESVEAGLRGRFRFVEENAGTKGLRAPQLGALHAILAARSLDPYEAVTIVLPTGTGKTETMLGLYCIQPQRSLVVVPSDALRTQIATKFASLGVLPATGAIEGEHLAPVVGVVKSRFETASEVLEFCSQANVLVATAAALSRSSSEAISTLVKECPQLFIDEAHHLGARTWGEIAESFRTRSIVQFTATPFREDGRVLEGRIAYAYPLRLAQENGWFATINYQSITVASDVDRALADAAVNQLRSDIAAGRDHILMARVQSVQRADDLLAIYKEIAADLEPVRIDSRLAKVHQRRGRSKLDDRSSRIVVCVDMLGEGFDLPSLKVAALHDPHKSLAVTLQFIGRFARTGAQELGDASVFVPRLSGLMDERLRRLYAEDSDWNTVIRDLTHAEVEHEQARSDFEGRFSQLPTEVAIRGIQPKMSTVVYRSPALSWNSEKIYEVYDESALLTKRIAVNSSDRVVWFITSEAIPVRWGDFNAFHEVVHHLYLIHADVTRGLLYINSTNNDSVHEALAKAVGGAKVDLIRGDVVYRVLAPIARRVPTNVGLLDAVNRNRRFTMHVGADVLEGFGINAAQKSKTNIFAHGYAEHSRVSVGASRKGRIWSHKVARSIHDWVNWARRIGTVVTDESIDLATVMSGFIMPTAATSRPKLVPLGLEWPHDIGISTSESRQVSFNGVTHPMIDLDLVPRTFDRDNPIEFDVVSDDWSIRYVLVFGDERPVVKAKSGDATIELPSGVSANLADFMTQVGLTVYFESEALLSPDGYLLKPNRESPRLSSDRLEVVNWTGINIRKESQGPSREKDSVQYRVAELLSEESDWEIVLDDDGSGEIADLVLIRRDDRRIEIVLAHCKYSSEDAPGARVGDLYEVCGQAAKCHKPKADVELTLQRLLRREQRRQAKGRDGFIVGNISTLHEVLDECWRLDPSVTVLIAQPGLSKKAMSIAQSELLGCVELYLSETYGSRFRVLCSE